MSCPAERELGVLVGSRINRNQQQALAAQRANCTLGCSRTHSRTSQSKEVTVLLYSVLVGPQLECCAQSGAPQFKDVKFPDESRERQQNW